VQPTEEVISMTSIYDELAQASGKDREVPANSQTPLPRAPGVFTAPPKVPTTIADNPAPTPKDQVYDQAADDQAPAWKLPSSDPFAGSHQLPPQGAPMSGLGAEVSVQVPLAAPAFAWPPTEAAAVATPKSTVPAPAGPVQPVKSGILPPPPPEITDDDDEDTLSVQPPLLDAESALPDPEEASSPKGWQEVGGHWFTADTIFENSPPTVLGSGSGAPQVEDFFDSEISRFHLIPPNRLARAAGVTEAKYSSADIAEMARLRVDNPSKRLQYYQSMLNPVSMRSRRIVTSVLAGDGGIGKSTVATNCAVLEQSYKRRAGSQGIIFDADTSRGVIRDRMDIAAVIGTYQDLGATPNEIIDLLDLIVRFPPTPEGLYVVPSSVEDFTPEAKADLWHSAFDVWYPYVTDIWNDLGSDAQAPLTDEVLGETDITVIVTRPRLFTLNGNISSEGLGRLEYIENKLSKYSHMPDLKNTIIVVNKYRGESLTALYDRYNNPEKPELQVGAITTLREDPTLKQDDRRVRRLELSKSAVSDLTRILALKQMIADRMWADKSAQAFDIRAEQVRRAAETRQLVADEVDRQAAVRLAASEATAP
jgi:MinD-like ATPase involved in chromosome partitioning or flagellar assembly